MWLCRTRDAGGTEEADARADERWSIEGTSNISACGG